MIIFLDKEKTRKLAQKKFMTMTNFLKCSGIPESSYYKWINQGFPWYPFNTVCRILECEDEEVVLNDQE
jgi:predicted transcriptional regulator